MLLHYNGTKSIGFAAVDTSPFTQVGIGAVDLSAIDCGHCYRAPSIAEQFQLPVFSSKHIDKTPRDL
jgi:hypothetical protein